MASLIMVVEDDDDQRRLLGRFLTDSGFSTHLARDGASALKILDGVEPDLAILDLGLPDISGETVFLELHKSYPNLPVIILSASGGNDKVVNAFNLGVDDYVTKPYNFEELLVRIKARLKNSTNVQKLKVADLELDTKTFEVRRAGKLVKLTPKEFQLLEYLMQNTSQVLSREMILSRIWMYSPDMESRAVDVYMGYLRKKIDSGHKKKLVQSVRGFGYKLKG